MSVSKERVHGMSVLGANLNFSVSSMWLLVTSAQCLHCQPCESQSCMIRLKLHIPNN